MFYILTSSQHQYLGPVVYQKLHVLIHALHCQQHQQPRLTQNECVSVLFFFLINLFNSLFFPSDVNQGFLPLSAATVDWDLPMIIFPTYPEIIIIIYLFRQGWVVWRSTFGFLEIHT